MMDGWTEGGRVTGRGEARGREGNREGSRELEFGNDMKAGGGRLR